MKPIKLTMSAFGPYADVQVIDFDKINEKNIFLITGPTGAGKTTIFDGIAFALYGEASGSHRETDKFRSDFADDGTLTYVEFDFELRGERYYIKRVPKQFKKKVHGEGFTEKSSEVEFVLPNKKVFNKKRDVDDKVIEIFGVTYQQFKQIVMLAQGEFRKLLHADSKDREAIFRKIFSTDSFYQVQELLQVKSKKLYGSILKTKERIKDYINNIDASEDETLSETINSEYINNLEILEHTRKLIVEDELKSKEVKGIISDKENEILVLNKKLVIANETNNKFNRKEQLEKQINELNSKGEYIKSIEERVFLGKKALHIKPIEEQYRELNKELFITEKKYNEELSNLNNLEYKLKQVEKDYRIEKEKEPIRIQLNKKIISLEKDISKFELCEEVKNNLIELEKDFNVKEKNYKELKDTLQEFKNDHLLLSGNLELLKDLEQKLFTIKEEKNNLGNNNEKLHEINKEYNLYSRFQNNHSLKTNEYNLQEGKYKSMKSSYESSFELFKKGQAGILSTTLKCNQPCPVCGSLDHPNPASLHDEVPTEEELNNLKHKVDKENELIDKLLENLISLKTQVDEKKNTITNIISQLSSNYLIKCNIDNDNFKKELDDKINLVDVSVKGKENELKILENKQKEKQEINNKLKQLELDIKEIDDTIEESHDTYQQARLSLTSERKRLKDIEKELPNEFKNLNDLNYEIKHLKVKLENMIDTLNNKENLYNQIILDLSSSRTLVKSIKENMVNISEKISTIKEKYDSLVKKSGFNSIESYKEFVLEEKQIQGLDEEINSYYNNKKSLSDRLNDLIIELKDKTIINTDEIIKTINVLKEEKENLSDKQIKIISRIKVNKQVVENLDVLIKENNKYESQYERIGELSNIANGKPPHNSQRLTFERFVLAAYFEEIIYKANIRLGKMTGNRYKLVRKQDKGKGAAQQGLDLEVFDYYTGKKRHVKTLSGGESFKASLALALGLADIVQSYSGGISLDTIFIDEGFGSLDPESLEHAIDTLASLQQSGRLVGVISHVQELKDRIESKLEIIPSKKGSIARFNM